MGDFFWSQSGCNVNGRKRPEIWWYGEPGKGSWLYNTATGSGPWFVSGPIYANWSAGGHECGGAGAPTGSERLCGSGPFVYKSWQPFEGGRFVVGQNNVAHFHWQNFANGCSAAMAGATGSEDDIDDDDAWLDEEIDVPDPPVIVKGKAANAGRVSVHRVKRRDMASG